MPSSEYAPNFMVVGAAKSGTTSLYHYFRTHTELCVPTKESYLFTPELNRETRHRAKVYTEEEYRTLFKQAWTAPTRAAGEVSSIYLYCHAEVIPEVKRILGDIKIIIVLRNPVERAFSNYSFFARDVRDERTFEEAVDEELSEAGHTLTRPLHYVQMGFYAEQVKAYQEHFSEVHVVLFEDLVRNPEETLVGIYHFLGVSAEQGCERLQAYNSSGKPKRKWLQKLLFRPSPFKIRMKEFFIRRVMSEETFARWIESARKLNLEKVSIKPETREQLRTLYKDDILKLQSIIDEDLSAWLK